MLITPFGCPYISYVAEQKKSLRSIFIVFHCTNIPVLISHHVFEVGVSAA